MIDIVPVAKTSVDWDTLLQGAKRALGRSVSASIDDSKLAMGTLGAYCAAMAEFARAGSDPLKALRSDRLCLRHAYFSFLVAAPSSCTFKLSSLGLTVTRSDDFAIVSGRLSEWYRAVTDGLTAEVDDEFKQLLCHIVAWFEREDLGQIWGEHEKVHRGSLYHLVPK